MSDPAQPVVTTTPEEQRRNTTLSLTLLQKGAQKRQQKIMAGDIPMDGELAPHNPNAVIPGTETGYRRNKFNPKTPGGQDYTTGTGYQETNSEGKDNTNKTTGYSKQDLEDIQQLLKAGKYDELEKKYGIDVKQLQDPQTGLYDPKKVQAFQQTVDVLVINYDTVVDLSDDQAKADVFMDAYDKKDPNAKVHHITGTVTYRDRKTMTPADIQKLIDEAKQAEAGQPPVQGGNPNAALMVQQIGKRNALTTTTYPTQQAVDAQIARFIDVMVESSKQGVVWDDETLKKFAKLFSPDTSAEDRQKIAVELKIDPKQVEAWRKDPETMKLGQGFTGALQDQHTRGDAVNLYPDGDEACNNTISTKDLLALKAGFLGQSPLKLPPGSPVNEAVYRQNTQTTVSDMRIQLIKQGYVQPNLPGASNSGPNYYSPPVQPVPYDSGGYPQGGYPGGYGGYQGMSKPLGPELTYDSSPYGASYGKGSTFLSYDSTPSYGYSGTYSVYGGDNSYGEGYMSLEGYYGKGLNSQLYASYP